MDSEYDKPFVESELRNVKTENTTVQYSCEECGSVLKTKSGLTKHTKSKHRGFLYYCDKCDFKAESLTEFVMHVKSPHQTQMETSLSCVECNLNFQRDFDLELHKSLKHPGNLHQFRRTKTKTKCKKDSV